VKLLSYSPLHNFIWFQSTWFLAVLFGQHIEWLLFLLIALHVYLSGDWLQELKVIVPCATLGVAVDCALSYFGVFMFTPDPSLLSIPIWLVAVWLALSGCFRHSMNYLIKKPLIMTILAALFAPLSYIGAARLGAVDLPLGQWQTGVIIGLCWLIVTPLLVGITHLAARTQSDQKSAKVAE